MVDISGGVKNRGGINRLALRQELWPNIDEDLLWSRKRHAGFVNIPRTMPHLAQIMDQLSNRQPVSSTYLALWCHLFDESIVIIRDPNSMAFEAGYAGQRADATWKKKMAILDDLGFIQSKPGPHGPFNFVLVLHPHKVVKKLYDEKKGLIRADTYNAFIQRALEIGAKDF